MASLAKGKQSDLDYPGPAGATTGVLSRYNFRNKAVHHLPVLEANLPRITKGPASVVIHPTNGCNAKCPMCRYADLRAESETIPLETLKGTIRDLGEMGTKSIVLSGGGEPTIYRGLAEVIELASGLGIKVGIVTNFIRVNDELIDSIVNHVDWVRVSMNASSPAGYLAAQGMEPELFPRMVQNVRLLVQRRNLAGSKLVIGGSFIVQKGNYTEVGDFVDLCTSLGVNYAIFRPVQTWSPTASLGANSLGLTKEELDILAGLVRNKVQNADAQRFVPNNMNKIIDLFMKFEEKKQYPRCLSTYVEAAIGGDGHVYPCCQHVGNRQFSCGNITTASFRDVWMGYLHKQVRNEIDPAMCPPCRYHAYNLVFNKYVDGWRPTEEEIQLSAETADVDFL